MISQTTEYALRAMAWLAINPNQRVPSGELAENTQVPRDYLAKVLQQLAEAALIQGRRGVNGGYQLTRPPEKIRLLDVVHAVNAIDRIKTCPLGLSSHGTRLCPLHRTLDNAIAAMLDALGDKTLADMVNTSDANTPLCETKSHADLTIDHR